MSFWCLQFLPKNERKQVDLRFHSSKVEFVCSFFWKKNIGLKKSFWLCLTFKMVKIQLANCLIRLGLIIIKTWVGFVNSGNMFYNFAIKMFRSVSKSLLCSIHFWKCQVILCSQWQVAQVTFFDHIYNIKWAELAETKKRASFQIFGVGK